MADIQKSLDGLLLGIDHVGFAVADLDAAIERWERTFGFIVDHRETNAEQGVEEAMLAVGDGTHIQLLAPLSPESTIGRYLAKSGEGIQQIAFRVSDISAASAALVSAGVRLIYEKPKVGTAGALINFVHPKDTGGVLVELVQPVAH